MEGLPVDSGTPSAWETAFTPDLNRGKPARALRAQPRRDLEAGGLGMQDGKRLGCAPLQSLICVWGRGWDEGFVQPGGRGQTPPLGEGSWVTFLLAHPKWPVGAWLELRAWAWPPRINQSRQCGSSLIKVQGFNRSFKNSQITPTPGPATWPAAPGARQLLARPVEARPGRGSCLFPEDAGRRARPTFSAAFNLP